jgi:hypothetical protein
VLVLERPGRNATAGTTPAAIASEPQPPPPPPPADAVVDALELGPYGVAVEAEPTRVTAIVLSPAGGGASGLPVTINGTPARACGHGCYRIDASPSGIRVGIGALEGTFALPRRAPNAEAAVRHVQQWFRAQRGATYIETLASDLDHTVSAGWRLEAPDRVSYRIAGGAQGVVIGDRRWDRASAGARWVESAQTPSPQPTPPWTFATNAHRVAPDVITFADWTIPAFFRLTLYADGRPVGLEMTAAAHFMRDTYVSFDSARRIRPPR